MLPNVLLFTIANITNAMSSVEYTSIWRYAIKIKNESKWNETNSEHRQQQRTNQKRETQQNVR